MADATRRARAVPPVHRLPPLLLAVALVLSAGCASRSAEVAARGADPAAYAGWSCERLHDELDAVQVRAADVAYAVDARAGNNMIALGLGVSVFWPALLALRPDGQEATTLAELKGRFEGVRLALARDGCGAAPAAMASAKAAALPVREGDRLVYEERASQDAPPHRLGMRVLALRRDGIDFAVDYDGAGLSGTWQQDLSGNPKLDGRPALLAWRRLLKPTLDLGQVVYGELAAAGEQMPSARVRGQVVATGPQVLDGRRFDVAVIELYGDAPVPVRGIELDQGSTRLDGVMAVDRNSGLLLRLELRCANPDFALRRRLLRVESAGA